MISGVLTGHELAADHAVAALSGELRLGTMPDVQRVLGKLLAERSRLIVDLADFRLRWRPAVQVFPTALAAAGGWPAACLVLFGADRQMQAALAASRVVRTIPLVADRAAAERQVQLRPPRVHREHELPRELTAPRAARSLVQQACADWSVPGLAADAAIVTSELVTNAVEHTPDGCLLHLGLDDRGLWIEVRDRLPGTEPRLRPHLLTSGRGRGLEVVDLLCRHWGVTRQAGGKTVWALITAEAG